MSDHHTTKRDDRNDLVNAPVVWHERCFRQYNHAGNTNHTKGKREPEPSQRLGHLDKEIGEFQSLRRGLPGHVDFKHVGQQGLGDVGGDAAEEDEEGEEVFDVEPKGREECHFADAVAENGEGEISEAVEDDDED